jgi:hypothetical protein
MHVAQVDSSVVHEAQVDSGMTWPHGIMAAYNGGCVRYIAFWTPLFIGVLRWPNALSTGFAIASSLHRIQQQQTLLL